MKSFLGAVLALAAIGAAAQTTNFSQIQHIETALNHLTVIDFAEPVVTVAVADPDSIQIERHDDMVFLKPLKDGVSTNLFVWTASRQLAYEIDPAGDLAKMNVMIRNAARLGSGLGFYCHAFSEDILQDPAAYAAAEAGLYSRLA